MSQDVLACHRCGKPLNSVAFTHGRAQTIEGRSYCADCLPSLPEAEVKTVLSPLPATERSAGLPMPILIGLIVVAVLAVVAGVVAFRPKKPAASAGKEAVRKGETLQELHARVDGPAKTEKFGVAIAMLREARKSHDAPEWTGPVDERIRELQNTADELYQQLHPDALDLRKQGQLADVDKIKQRVAQWDMSVHSLSLERDLAAIRLPEALPAGGLRLIPSSGGDAFRVHRRYGTSSSNGVESVSFSGGRGVGFEGDLFQVPSDGEIQITVVTEKAQSLRLEMKIVGRKGSTVACSYNNIPQASPGAPIQVKASFNRFTQGGRAPAPGSVVKQLVLTGQGAFRVTEFVVVKRRD